VPGRRARALGGRGGGAAGGMGCFRAGKTDEDDEMRKEANRKIEKQLQKDKQAYRATHRLLLLGNSAPPIVARISLHFISLMQ